jgi:hypothetical protein
MREQVRAMNSVIEGTDVELLIGISVSRERTASHLPEAETLSDGLAGLCAALPARHQVNGVAIYADWEFSASDAVTWMAWRGAR